MLHHAPHRWTQLHALHANPAKAWHEHHSIYAPLIPASSIECNICLQFRQCFLTSGPDDLFPRRFCIRERINLERSVWLFDHVHIHARAIIFFPAPSRASQGQTAKPRAFWLQCLPSGSSPPEVPVLQFSFWLSWCRLYWLVFWGESLLRSLEGTPGPSVSHRSRCVCNAC